MAIELSIFGSSNKKAESEKLKSRSKKKIFKNNEKVIYDRTGLVRSPFFFFVESASAQLTLFGKGGMRRGKICPRYAVTVCAIFGPTSPGVPKLTPLPYISNVSILSLSGTVLYSGIGEHGSISPGMQVFFQDGTANVDDPDCSDCEE